MRKKLENKKGFTLAELLVVVAIIAVLIAIAIPVFGAAMEKAREATDLANIRAAYATLTVQYLDDGKSGTISVPVTQMNAGWEAGADYKLDVMTNGKIGFVDIGSDKTSGAKYKVEITSTGEIKVDNIAAEYPESGS